MLGTVLIVILVLLLLWAIRTSGQAKNWGYYFAHKWRKPPLPKRKILRRRIKRREYAHSLRAYSNRRWRHTHSARRRPRMLPPEPKYSEQDAQAPPTERLSQGPPTE